MWRPMFVSVCSVEIEFNMQKCISEQPKGFVCSNTTLRAELTAHVHIEEGTSMPLGTGFGAGMDEWRSGERCTTVWMTNQAIKVISQINERYCVSLSRSPLAQWQLSRRCSLTATKGCVWTPSLFRLGMTVNDHTKQWLDASIDVHEWKVKR